MSFKGFPSLSPSLANWFYLIVYAWNWSPGVPQERLMVWFTWNFVPICLPCWLLGLYLGTRKFSKEICKASLVEAYLECLEGMLMLFCHFSHLFLASSFTPSFSVKGENFSELMDKMEKWSIQTHTRCSSSSQHPCALLRENEFELPYKSLTL